MESKDLVITRLFDAPRLLIWKAWTECARTKRWWGPKDFTAPECRIDLRVGGRYLLCMRSPEGKDFWSTGAYLEIIEPERLVMTDSFADEKGNVVSPAFYGFGEDFPRELKVTVTFKVKDGKTEMTLVHSGFPPGELLDQTRAGWNGSFDKLAASLF